jgi:hypothetical protein
MAVDQPLDEQCKVIQLCTSPRSRQMQEKARLGRPRGVNLWSNEKYEEKLLK